MHSKISTKGYIDMRYKKCLSFPTVPTMVSFYFDHFDGDVIVKNYTNTVYEMFKWPYGQKKSLS